MPGIRRASTLIRLAALAAAAVLMAGACAANQAAPDIPLGQNGALATAVPDGPFDAGRGASVVLDPSGDPEVSYILLQPKLKTGEIAPPPVIGQPSPPSVVLAALSQGRWSRTAVTGLPTVGSNDRGNATGIAAKNDLPGPVVSTALAIDPQGKHHVAWSATDGLYYDTDATGSFGSPQKVVKTTTLGASLALAPDGTPWISFYEGSDVKVAHFVGGKWQIQTVGPATVPTAAATTAVRASSTGAFVGFGSGDTTMVGVQTGGRAGWTAESVPGPGGFGVSMALESKGVPSVAYYDSSGVVHLATRSGKATWSAQDVATTKAGPDARWGTGIAVDDHGVHALTYLDMKTGEVFLATDKSGGFTSTPVPNSVGGATPAIAVSTDGTNLAVAFFDTVNANLVVATPAQQGLPPLAFLPSRTLAPTSGPSGPACSPTGTTVQAVAKGIAFDKKCLAAPAGTAFTIDFNNQDAGVPHNLEVFTDSSATTRLGGATGPTDTIAGPKTVTYNVTPLKKGTYYFQCDVHPTQMNGLFIVS